MSCPLEGSTYTPNYTFPLNSSVLRFEGKAYGDSSRIVEVPGEVSSVVRITALPDLQTVSSWQTIGGLHVHTRVLAGSLLNPPNDPSMIVRTAPNSSATGIRLSRYVQESIGKSAQYLLLPWDVPPLAERIEITPLTNFDDIDPASLPEFVEIGSWILLKDRRKNQSHSLYGNVFNSLCPVRVISVNRETQWGLRYQVEAQNVNIVVNATEYSVYPVNPISTKRPKEIGCLETTYKELKSFRKVPTTPVLIVGPTGTGKRAMVRHAFPYAPVHERSLFEHHTIQDLQNLWELLDEPWTLLLRHFAEALDVMTWQQEDEIGRLANLLSKLVKSKPQVRLVATWRKDSLPQSIRALFPATVFTHRPGIEDRAIIWHMLGYDGETGQAGASIEDLIRYCGDPNPPTGQTKIPNVKWEDVGGLASAKQDIIDTVQLPLQRGSTLTTQRSGLLLWGPPGTGKTLLAKAVATECKLNFISVKGPELLNMYIGESEKNIRDVFERAREAKPSVLFFDEIDALAPARGRGSDSGGVVDRIVSQLLTELDGVRSGKDVFVIAATNRPDLLDNALLRPGRFDKTIGLEVPQGAGEVLSILNALTRKFCIDCDLAEIASQCQPGLTGADLYALCSEAALLAFKEKIENLESGAPDTETSPIVTLSHFQISLANLIPSVSEEELDHYRSLRDKF